jgi:hypothetical protein
MSAARDDEVIGLFRESPALRVTARCLQATDDLHADAILPRSIPLRWDEIAAPHRETAARLAPPAARDDRLAARAAGLEWRAGDRASGGYREFRRMPAAMA